MTVSHSLSVLLDQLRVSAPRAQWWRGRFFPVGVMEQSGAGFSLDAQGGTQRAESGASYGAQYGNELRALAPPALPSFLRSGRWRAAFRSSRSLLSLAMTAREVSSQCSGKLSEHRPCVALPTNRHRHGMPKATATTKVSVWLRFRGIAKMLYHFVFL